MRESTVARVGEWYCRKAAGGEVLPIAADLVYAAIAGPVDSIVQRRVSLADPRRLAEALRFLPQAAWEALRSPAAGAETCAQLTATERRVCGLVARGLTNKEIAQHLVVAPSTVHTHLKRVFRKLGVHSRAELAVWASRSRLDDLPAG